MVVHGDDFTTLGHEEDLNWLNNQFREKFEIKHRGRIGPDSRDLKEIRVLNRLISWTDGGIQYEADPRHAEIVIQALGLKETSKSVSTPCDRLNEQVPTTELDSDKSSEYRAIVARINYLSLDRSDISYGSKELCRDMCKPTLQSSARLKRMGRYLLGKPRAVIEFNYQSMPMHLWVTVDADHAGDKISRKSTSGGCIQFGEHVTKHWSSTQSIIALSSGEAEFYAMVKGCSNAMGARSMIQDFHVEMPQTISTHIPEEFQISVNTDSSAALGICKRRGLGKVRHIDVAELWIQEKVSMGKIEVHKISGKLNAADGLTKPVGFEDLKLHCELCHLSFPEGRHSLAPKICD